MGVIHLGIGRKVPKGRDICIPTADIGFPGGSDGKESACNAGDLGSIHGLERSPGGSHGNPCQYSCLENPLVTYSPWDPNELDMTKHGRATGKKMN